MQVGDGLWYQRPCGTKRFKLVGYRPEADTFEVLYEGGRRYPCPATRIIPWRGGSFTSPLVVGDRVVYAPEGKVYISRATGARIEGVVTQIEPSSSIPYLVDWDRYGRIRYNRRWLMKIISTPTQKRMTLGSFIDKKEKEYA